MNYQKIMHESLFQVTTMNLVSTKLTLGIQVSQGLPNLH